VNDLICRIFGFIRTSVWCDIIVPNVLISCYAGRGMKTFRQFPSHTINVITNGIVNKCWIIIGTEIVSENCSQNKWSIITISNTFCKSHSIAIIYLKRFREIISFMSSFISLSNLPSSSTEIFSDQKFNTEEIKKRWISQPLSICWNWKKFPPPKKAFKNWRISQPFDSMKVFV